MLIFYQRPLRLAKRLPQKTTSRRPARPASKRKERRLRATDNDPYLLLKELGIIGRDGDVDEKAIARCLEFLEGQSPEAAIGAIAALFGLDKLVS